MEFEKDDSLEVDAILERIKNKLSMRNSNPIQNFSSDDEEYYDDDNDVVDLPSERMNNNGAYSSPQITKPLFLNEGVRGNSDTINIVDPNVIPNPFGSSMKHNVVKSNPAPVINESKRAVNNVMGNFANTNNTNINTQNHGSYNNMNNSMVNNARRNVGLVGSNGVIDLTPNMELHLMNSARVQDYDATARDSNVIDIALNEAEYKLLVDVLSKRFCKAFSLKYLQNKVEKWLDANLKDLLASK